MAIHLSPVFVHKQLQPDMESPDQARLLLHRWAKASHILQLKKGMYMTRRFYEQHRADYSFTAVVSAILIP
ncbi:MAG: hypothetical protein Q8L41_06305 [Anaerolineales bacterium]|nr:hypothetical protein [Anaerolineales bacterium]